MKPIDVPGILLLYHRELGSGASTIMEHVDAFRRYSRFKVWNVNTEGGFPPGLNHCRFQFIVLHYSLFGRPAGYHFDERFADYLDRNGASYKIAFFQDEHHYCQRRFAFLNRHRVDCVYTLLEPEHFETVYGKHTGVATLVYTIPGYVPDELVELGARLARPDRERRIDVGYRGRKLAPYMGRGALEKYDVAIGFRRHAALAGLSLDIEADEQSRIYGENWHRFIAECRAVLGVEAGVSIFDVDDVVRTEYERVLASDPAADFAALAAPLLARWEGNIPYRTISPRHFEAAALRTCQILFEGSYSGLMQPMVHYIPLKKDFSNVDDVLCLFRDEALRQELTDRAYRDLITSGEYSYRRFIADFDQELERVGMQPAISPAIIAAVDRHLARGRIQRHVRTRLLAARRYPFPGRRFLRPLAKPILARVGEARAARLPSANP